MDRNQHNRSKRSNRARPPKNQNRLYDQDRRPGTQPWPSGMKQVILPLGTMAQSSQSEPKEQERRAKPPRRRPVSKGKMRRRRRRLRLLALLVAFALIIAGVLFSAGMLFKISAVKVESTDKNQPVDTGIYSEEDILNALDVPLQSSIFAFSSRQKAENISHALPELEKVQVRRSLPSTVIVRVEPAVARFCLETDNGWAVLSENRKVMRIEEEKPEGLILLTGLDVSSALTGYTLAVEDETESKESSALDKAPLEVLQDLMNLLDRENLTDGVSAIELGDVTELCFSYEWRVRVLLGTINNLDYKMQLAGYLLRNENGDALGESDEGTLDCSHISQNGKINPVFSPGSGETPAPPEPEEEPEEPQEDPDGETPTE